MQSRMQLQHQGVNLSIGPKHATTGLKCYNPEVPSVSFQT